MLLFMINVLLEHILTRIKKTKKAGWKYGQEDPELAGRFFFFFLMAKAEGN